MMKEENMSELRFDSHAAKQMADFLVEYMSPLNTFRLMKDVFPKSFDLTVYDEAGKEITHIHPRDKDAFQA